MLLTLFEVGDICLIKIPWKSFSEEEIQHLIQILLQYMEYENIRNLHASDRSHEQGADITAERNAETTAIAVKVKPNNADRVQLIDLAKRSEKRKMYAYVDTPSVSFQKEMKRQLSVEYYDSDKLSGFFFKNCFCFAFDILLSKHRFTEVVRSIQNELKQLYREHQDKSKKPLDKMTKMSFEILWRLKDTTASLHKFCAMGMKMFFGAGGVDARNVEDFFLRSFLECIEEMTDYFESFHYHFNEFLKSNKQLVFNTIIETKTLSNWSHLLGWGSRALDKGDFIRIFDENQKYSKDILGSENDVFSCISGVLDGIRDFAWTLESLIDDILKEYLRFDLPSPDMLAVGSGQLETLISMKDLLLRHGHQIGLEDGSIKTVRKNRRKNQKKEV